MSHRLRCKLRGYEYRGMRSGQGANGRTWMSIICEEGGQDPNQLDVSVPADMQADVMNLGLRKGDLLDMVVLAVAGSSGGRSYDYVQLQALPEAAADDTGLGF